MVNGGPLSACRESVETDTRREGDECLNRVSAKFDDAKVRSFVLLRVRRYVREELRASLVNA
jgi:hypothetical protein